MSRIFFPTQSEDITWKIFCGIIDTAKCEHHMFSDMSLVPEWITPRRAVSANILFCLHDNGIIDTADIINKIADTVPTASITVKTRKIEKKLK
jgi:hypothetical protein